VFDRIPRYGRFHQELTLAVVIVFLTMPVLALAQQAPSSIEVLTDGQTLEVQCTVGFSADMLVFGELLGYDTVRLEGGECLNVPGQPMLPAKQVRIALPAGMAVTGVRVVDSETVGIAGQYLIFPAQPPRHVSDSAQADFVVPDPATYASTAAYPSKLVEFTHQTDLAGQGIALLRLYPVQYVPAEQRLTLHTSITFVLEGTDGYECGDYLPIRISERGLESYERMVADMVVNPEDVELRPAEFPPPQTLGVGPGDYDYVIIAQTSWLDDFQPLADWKTKKGVPATVVDRDWIYGEYSGTTDQAKIRAFVQDARNNWGTMYFLLGGDTNTIPYHIRNIDGDDIPNDTYYADYDADWTCEVHVGRAAVRTTGAISTFISKALSYEQTPPSNYNQAAFFGFDLYTYGSDEGEDCKADIRSLYVPGSWIYRREYDSESGSHKSDVIGYLNQGHNLVNHIDHSDTDYMGAGATNHDDYLTNSDMSGLTNGNRQSILYSIGCWPCNYPDYTCIAEAFVQNAGGGGVAFIGNSRYGWYTPYSGDNYSLHYDRYFFRSLFAQNHYVLGECFSDHKNDAYASDTRYIFTELTLLGDPELRIWTDEPDSLTCTHNPTLPVGSSVFGVHVEDGSGNLAGATVCLWKGDEVYVTGVTNTSGNASFTPAPATEGTMYVTVTKRDYRPYVGSAEVVGAQYVLTTICDGGGIIWRDPNEATYPAGQTVELTAFPYPGWSFNYWSGNLSGNDNPETIYMNGDKTVTAHFTQDQYTLTVNVDGSGSVTKNPNQATYTYGQVVELTANAAQGWSFDHWSGDLSGSDNPDEITITGDGAVTAHFTEDADDCPEDLNGNEYIDLQDLAALLANYGQTGMGPEDGDFDGDSDVDLQDLAQLLSVYGQDCPTR
jgi:hypothetical protein